MIVRWVQDFHKKGLDGLREKVKGRASKMSKEPIQPTESKDLTSIIGANTTQEYYLNELARKLKESEEKFAKKEEELLHAEIQSRYLKELWKLRLKWKAETMSKPAKMQESSTNSEDFTN